jgi:LysR family transcriptional regulator for bpeEF and oprC
MDSTSLFRGVVPFVMVAEELSFRKAAARLGVSAAAISKAVKLLEEELGVSLLQRTSRDVALTQEGEAFLERCQEAILALKGARQEASDARSTPRGQLSISASFIVAQWVIRAMQPLAARHPKLSFVLSVTDRLARFVEDDIDVAIRVGPLQDSALSAKRLRETRWRIVASPTYLARFGIPKTEGDLASHRCLRFVPPSGKPRPWVFQGEPVELQEFFLVDHGPTLLEAASAGLGLAQVLDFMLPPKPSDAGLITVLEESEQKGPDIFALYTKQRAKSPNVKALIEALSEAL